MKEDSQESRSRSKIKKKGEKTSVKKLRRHQISKSFSNLVSRKCLKKELEEDGFFKTETKFIRDSSVRRSTPIGTKRTIRRNSKDVSDTMLHILGARELQIKRGDNPSIIDASINKTCARYDFINEPSELICLMPHHSRKLNIDNYVLHLQH